MYASQLKRFPDDRVLYLINRLRFLQLRILEQETIHKTTMNSDVDVFVDRCRNEESAVLAIIGRQISPAAAQRNSQWRTRNDHP